MGMGDMVVLNLQEDVAALRSELTANQEKYQNIQKEYESEQAISRKNAELNKNLEGKLDTQFKRVEDLVKKLGDEHSNLNQVQQSLNSAQQENSIIKAELTEEMGKNVTLTNTIKQMEISYATATFALGQEKLNVIEMV